MRVKAVAAVGELSEGPTFPDEKRLHFSRRRRMSFTCVTHNDELSCATNPSSLAIGHSNNVPISPRRSTHPQRLLKRQVNPQTTTFVVLLLFAFAPFRSVPAVSYSSERDNPAVLTTVSYDEPHGSEAPECRPLGSRLPGQRDYRQPERI